MRYMSRDASKQNGFLNFFYLGSGARAGKCRRRAERFCVRPGRRGRCLSCTGANHDDAPTAGQRVARGRRKRNTDQPALDLGAARLLVEDGVEIDALPTTYNFKIAPCDPHHDMRRQALGAAHLVRGPVRLIHHKNMKHPHTLCKLVNAAASAPRVVVGATACAMHDPSEIRVHELRDGSPWLD